MGLLDLVLKYPPLTASHVWFALSVCRTDIILPAA